uniref:Uncharacterized protein n=1 Tax=Noctiluca scintillans TaxID=2966 RepID=A0A7S1FG21_NOCSC|mmetsp:Transcript_60519/g.160910  ORF Transcript_60519/g.160910 Transcript_60519/m.160910 type:complete len:390 (+) Transcript_60519:34-1203(+)|eukprot:CAMPEP_0194501404 /NCGR_PEP_ID=MMETSP0253-20130528/22650_1 /TAXON_ID=2966 /ORGANISM="Noctiluca scintillans" /LENGTH=389 /DNA_ID=CAMNT_0039343373 /DNA_START=26 /DNA_END=1195 /DNA_ORIENTATION=+
MGSGYRKARRASKHDQRPAPIVEQDVASVPHDTDSVNLDVVFVPEPMEQRESVKSCSTELSMKTDDSIKTDDTPQAYDMHAAEVTADTPSDQKTGVVPKPGFRKVSMSQLAFLPSPNRRRTPVPPQESLDEVASDTGSAVPQRRPPWELPSGAISPRNSGIDGRPTSCSSPCGSPSPVDVPPEMPRSGCSAPAEVQAPRMSYREQLRANGQQAMQRAWDRSLALKASRQNSSHQINATSPVMGSMPQSALAQNTPNGTLSSGVSSPTFHSTPMINALQFQQVPKQQSFTGCHQSPHQFSETRAFLAQSQQQQMLDQQHVQARGEHRAQHQLRQPQLMSTCHHAHVHDQGFFAMCQGHVPQSPAGQPGFWLNDEQMAEKLRAASHVLYED